MGDKENWGRGMWRVSSVEEDFNDLQDTPSLDCSQPLLRAPLSSPTSFMKILAMVAGMEDFTLIQKHWLPFTKADLAMTTAKWAICQQLRSTLSLRYDAILQGDKPVTWWQVDYIGPLPTQKGESFVLTTIDTLDMGLSSLHTMLLPELPFVDLQNASCTVMVSYTALLLIKELTSQQRSATMGPRWGNALVLPRSPLS